MTVMNRAGNPGNPRLQERIEVIDQTIDIMERHAASMSAAEDELIEEMRRWDREYKDEHLHSVPRSRKHVR
ncbi:hypothetical protein EDC39_10160 [Geothermobacter ehrlichii]|uniref:Uncharacterized protein n=2 Tax=Geothermobacter ehrlichii TaxID=213224 RepID=A0A5D3WM30_9BACT|nr:hypothetical protein EDC39_10160 [Geothermobacter ehrlichii]